MKTQRLTLILSVVCLFPALFGRTDGKTRDDPMSPRRIFLYFSSESNLRSLLRHTVWRNGLFPENSDVQRNSVILFIVIDRSSKFSRLKKRDCADGSDESPTYCRKISIELVVFSN